MARPLRIEFAGAIYHITSRGNARQDIYEDDEDRVLWLAALAKTCDRHGWHCHAYCLMSNHYHILIETPSASLSKGMKLLNGSYTQSYNRRHKRVGHLFQGRYKAILVERDSHLLELCRYVVLNPVRARMVRNAQDWPWSSYLATAGMAACPDFLQMDWILGNFGQSKDQAVKAYLGFVKDGENQPGPWEGLKNQIYLGSDQFVEDMQCRLDEDSSLKDIPRPQKLAPQKPLSYFADQYGERTIAMAQAYRSGHYTLSEVGEHFGVSYATVSRAVKKLESGCKM